MSVFIEFADDEMKNEKIQNDQKIRHAKTLNSSPDQSKHLDA